MIMHYNPIICAIDSSDLAVAKKLIKATSPHVGLIKLGLEFFTAFGREGVNEVVKSGAPVFLDLKLHDIPNTVSSAVAAAVSLNVEMLTVHASGGSEMLAAAVKAANKKTKILAVTVLTSLNESDLQSIGFSKRTVTEQVLQLADIAYKSGVDGIVCSANELEELKKIYKDKLKFVVPGIRPQGSDVGDQKRVMTPTQAIQKGADYIVIGRPITNSKDPAKAAEEIYKNLVMS
mgnify:CR=1 FL=1